MTLPGNKDFLPPQDPWSLFAEWYRLAETYEVNNANAMSLATTSKDSMPSVRMVLMKEFDERGISFYTNQNSRKGEQLKANAQAALCFYWKSLARQIRFEGHVNYLSPEEADLYFSTRPRGSQIGAWASQQSKVLDSREHLLERVKEVEQKYKNEKVPRPPHWGGYRLQPTRIEFWQDREFRLHDRILYLWNAAQKLWTYERLYP